jgi:hypothetical protein
MGYLGPSRMGKANAPVFMIPGEAMEALGLEK